MVNKTKKIKIKDLKIGDKIKTFANGEVVYKKVLDKFDTIVNKDEQRIVELDNGTKIHCSNRHPFMCLDGLNMIEVKPDGLTNQHQVIIDGGETASVVSVTGDDQPTSYIDITVEDTETFFCSDHVDNVQVLTHNCSQGSIRSSASTLFFPFWHLEIESLLVLKNNRGTEENRLRHSDYGLKLNRVFYERALKNQDIYLFSPHQVPKLKEAFYSSDIEEFERVYEEYAKDSTITKKVIPARELMDVLVDERSSTGRIYVLNIDHANTHSPFNTDFAQVRQSNLCMEILLVSKPFLESVREGYSKQYVKVRNKGEADNMISRYGFIPKTREGEIFDYVTSVADLKDNIQDIEEYNVMEDTDAEVALCILGAINLGDLNEGNIHSGVLEDRIYKIVRGLDNLIDLQEYPVKAGEISAKMRRTLGIGVTNFAYFLAKNGVRYSDGSGNNLTHILFEAIQYYAIKASVELAKERGKCEYFGDTNYAKGILPIDTYKKDVDELVEVGYKCDWDFLRKEILTHGMRHSTLTALMPVESSARVTNSINGIEPPKALFTVKDGIPTVVPEVNELFMDYECMWQMDNTGYIHLVAIMQKFIDQSISANTHYDPSRMENGKVPSRLIIKDMYEAYRLGVKTLYYHYTNDNSTSQEEEHCESCAV